MSDIEYLEKKRMEVLEAIKPICEVHNIKEYDYVVKETGQSETLILNGVKIGCSSNSISAIIDEVIGYLFIERWCHHRYLGTFSTQSQNVIKRYWL